MSRNPYPVEFNVYTSQLHALHYPKFVIDLVYPEYCETVKSDSKLEFWQHPDLNSGKRITGHDVHRYLIGKDLISKTVSFHHLHFYEVYPKTIPDNYYNYSYILGWKGLAIDRNGDWLIPALYMKSPSPAIHWLFLSLSINAGQVTVLEI